jgi:hypothetical protein
MSYSNQLNVTFAGVGDANPANLASYGLASDATTNPWRIKNETLHFPEYAQLRMATPVYSANGFISVLVNSDAGGHYLFSPGSFGTQCVISTMVASGANVSYGFRRDDGLHYLSKKNGAERRRGLMEEFRSVVGLSGASMDGYSARLDWWQTSATSVLLKGTFVKGGTTKVVWFEDVNEDPLSGPLTGPKSFGIAAEYSSVKNLLYASKVAGGSLTAGELVAYVRHADALYIAGTVPDGGANTNIIHSDYTYSWRIRPTGKTNWRTLSGTGANLLITGLWAGQSYDIERIAGDGATTATASLTVSTLASGEVASVATGTSIVEGQGNGYSADSPFPSALTSLRGSGVTAPTYNIGVGSSTPNFWNVTNAALHANFAPFCARYAFRYHQTMYGTNSAQYDGNSGWRSGAQFQSDMEAFTAPFRTANIRTIIHEDPARFGGATEAAMQTQLGTEYPAAVANLVTAYTPLVLRGQTTAFDVTIGSSANFTDNVHLSPAGVTLVAGTIAAFWSNWKTANAINISSQPADIQTFLGATPSISVVAAGGQALSYQWRVSEDGGSTWANASGGSGATTNTYVLPAVVLGDDNKRYACFISAEPGNVVRTREVMLSLSGSVSGVLLSITEVTLRGGETVSPVAVVLGSGSPSQTVLWTRRSGPADGGISSTSSNTPLITAPGSIVSGQRVVIWRCESVQNPAFFAELEVTVAEDSSTIGGGGGGGGGGGSLDPVEPDAQFSGSLGQTTIPAEGANYLPFWLYAVAGGDPVTASVYACRIAFLVDLSDTPSWRSTSVVAGRHSLRRVLVGTGGVVLARGEYWVKLEVVAGAEISFLVIGKVSVV